jgi:hypothetical protein
MSSEEAAAAAGGTASSNKDEDVDDDSNNDDAKDNTSNTRTTRATKSKPNTNASNGLEGIDIKKIMSSAGPVVQCVLLKHMSKTGRDTKPHASPNPAQNDGHPHKRPVLTELIEEVSVDTTPSKNQVQTVLGGPFTFLGQYPDERIVLMARREIPENVDDLSVHKIRTLCQDFGVDTETMLEKAELVAALLDAQLPVNPHQLQPPLDEHQVRGDILLMRVADTDEVLDKDDDDEDDEAGEGDEDDNAEGDATDAKAKSDVKGEVKETAGADAATEPQVTVPSNEEFFLNYTKKEWVAFASRTDVVAPEMPEGEDDEEEDEDDEDDDEDDEEYNAAEGAGDDDDEDDDEEERRAMLNLIMGEVLKRFREENGRGPDTRELLELRSQVANQLGVEVATFHEDENEEEEEEGARGDAKRPAGEAAPGEGSPKKVKFTAETKDNNGNDDDDADDVDDGDDGDERGDDGEADDGEADDDDNQKNGDKGEAS